MSGNLKFNVVLTLEHICAVRGEEVYTRSSGKVKK